MIRWLARKILKWWGWVVTGTIPNHMKKKIYIVIPHTSNWDFPVGILLKFGYKMDVQYLAKDSLFKPLYGWFFRMLGGIPVDRSKSSNMVDNIIDALSKYEKISIALAPEGTRKKVTKLKSGFYWISYKSGIPLIFVKFDWANIVVDFAQPFKPCGDYEHDLKIIEDHFKDVVGRVPEKGIYYKG